MRLPGCGTGMTLRNLFRGILGNGALLQNGEGKTAVIDRTRHASNTSGNSGYLSTGCVKSHPLFPPNGLQIEELEEVVLHKPGTAQQQTLDLLEVDVAHDRLKVCSVGEDGDNRVLNKACIQKQEDNAGKGIWALPKAC